MRALSWAALGLALAAPTAGASEARERDPLRIPLPRYDGTLTPYTFRAAYGLVTLVYDTITWRDAQGVPRPWLARSVRTGDDGRSVTIRLRRGLRWHDGRAVTARDVAFTFRHVAARPHPRFTPQTGAIAAVRALGRRTVRFRLRHRSPGFADQPLADVPILPRHLWRGLAPGRLAPRGLAVGSGPYRLVAADRRDGYRLEADPSYFRGPPRPAAIEVPIVRTAAATLQALDRRRVDMVPVTLPPGSRREVEGFGIRIERGPSYAGTALVFDTRRRPFRDAAARRSVAAALDPTQVARAAGDAVAARTGFLHPASRWAPGPLRAPPAAPEADLRRRVTVLAPDNDPVRREAGRQVVLAIRRAGGAARLATRRPAALERDLRTGFDAAIVTVPALVSHDPDFLRALFASGAALNVSGYASPAFDRLSARVASAAGPRARRRAVAAASERLARDAPAVPLFFSDGAFAYRPAAHDGWVFVRGTGILDKQSFLARRPVRRVAAPQPGSPGPAPGGGGLLSRAAVAMLAAAVALGALGLAARRSRP